MANGPTVPYEPAKGKARERILTNMSLMTLDRQLTLFETIEKHFFNFELHAMGLTRQQWKCIDSIKQTIQELKGEAPK